MTAYEQLKAAMEMFDAAKRTGTYQVGRSDLQAAVEVAIADLEGTLIDSDAGNVAAGTAWVNADDQAKLLKLTRQAQEILASADLIDDATLSEVVTKLVAANDAFDASKQKGTAVDSQHVIRRAGDTRIETAIALSQTAYSMGCDTVVIATGSNFPDALSGSSLAGALDAPILLADAEGLTDAVKAEIKRLGAKKAVLLGGTNVLPGAVYDQLAACGISESNVERLSGDTRYETNLDIYDEGKGSWSSTAIVVSGERYADALSIAPFANDSESPIFLADETGALPAETLSTIMSGGFDRVVIVGGDAVVSKSTESELRTALGDATTLVRLSGDDRYETNGRVNSWLLSSESGSGFTAENTGFATGSNFADALSGSSVLGGTKSVLVLVDPADERTALTRFGDNVAGVGTAYVFGGGASISTNFSSSLNDAIAKAA